MPSPASSSTRSTAKTIRRVLGSRDLTKRRPRTSTGISGALEEFAGEDGKQRMGLPVFVAVEITLSAVPRHELGVTESLLARGPAGREKPSKIIDGSRQFGAGCLAFCKIVEVEG